MWSGKDGWREAEPNGMCCMCVAMFACVCMCLCVYVYVHVYMYVCVCICVCVCVYAYMCEMNGLFCAFFFFSSKSGACKFQND